MIEQLPKEFTSVILGGGGIAPHNDSFKELRRKVREIIDHINNQQPKKPKSTNIALRQRIAELEKENVELKRKLKKQDDEDNLYDSFLKKTATVCGQIKLLPPNKCENTTLIPTNN